jgi:hypothetical protein
MQTQPENTQPVIACNLGAIDPAERAVHVDRAERVFAAVLETKELSDGYAFRLPLETAVLREIAEWMANERLCCPFFTFTLIVDDQLWLELTGPAEVKDELIAMAAAIYQTGGVPDKDVWIAEHTSEDIG